MVARRLHPTSVAALAVLLVFAAACSDSSTATSSAEAGPGVVGDGGSSGEGGTDNGDGGPDDGSVGTGGDGSAGDGGGDGSVRPNDPIPTYEVTITPNWVSPADDAASNYNAVWAYAKSPSTPYRSPDSFHQQSRYLLLDPRQSDADGRVGNDDWWFIIEKNWPADFPADNHGAWGREANFHNVAGDAGPSGGVGWGFGDGVSALALDWVATAAPEFSIEPESPNNHCPLPAPTRDVWHTYVVHFIAGRTDGTTPHSGQLTVWADGQATPVIDRTNINTVQRAKGPDNNDYVQRWMVLWEGDYTSNIPVKARSQFELTRIGKTYAEALADRPSLMSDSTTGQYYRGTGTDLGAPTLSAITSRTTGQSLLPVGL